ncbi:UNVERIFIED_CONTAM: hypothetical protein PYX00_001815 [Menopon gallinae]|uniref:Uncharacterized protein n=1 Tax=Menopon gallinae TaxID=328185 RepID=A0AAW2IGF2_9NEOP
MAAGDYGNCWLDRTPVQWVNDSLRIAYIILQMIIMSIVVYRVLDHFRRPRNEQALLHGRISIYTLALAPLFLLQFSLSASHPVHPEGEDAHVYTEYFFDGLQCAIASLPYLFLPEVVRFILDVLHLRRKNCHKVFETLPIPDPEMKLPDGHPSPSMQQLASGNDDFRLQTDVTYTSVLSPERFEKMINLYNRLNVIQKQQKAEDVPRNDPDNSSIRSVYYEVDNESVHTVYSDVIQSPVPEKEPKKEPWPNSHYTSKYLVEGSESSGSEESESTSKTGSCDSEATEIPSKSEALTLPEEAWTGKETIRAWLSACRGEFREPTAPEKAAPEVTLHRSLSANIVRTAEATGTVKVNIPQLKKPAPTRKKSAPPALAPKVEEEPKQPDNLPSIYDDLKNYPTRPKPTTPKVKKPDYSPDWANFRARLLDKRRTVRSTEALDVPEEPSTQIDALLSPRYDVGGLNSGTLKSSRFSRFATENLDKVGGEPERDDSIKRRKVEDWEPQQAFFIAGQ